MGTNTKKQLINWTSLIWALVALFVWIQGYDLTKLGLSESWIELIKFATAGIVVLLQALKPKQDETLD